MNKSIAIFMNRFGLLGFVRVLFYPLTTFITTPIRLVQTLWNCRILAEGRWGDYNHFTPYSGINFLFYWTAALTLYRFGRNGRSPYTGLGNYPLFRYFHYPLVSLYSYWGASTITVLLGMFGWLLAHSIWLDRVAGYWVVVIIFITAISTTFYANTFALQNYNAIGWLFFPLGLYGIFTGNWIISSVAWFFTSIGSPTVVFMAGILSIVSAIAGRSLVPVYALIPAALIILTHFSFSNSKDIKNSLLNLMKAIGLCRKSVRYRDKYSISLSAILVRSYFLLLYLQFFIVVYFVRGELPLIFLIGIIVFIVNSTYSPFADKQHVQMLMVSLAAAYILRTPNLWIFISYWFLISPLPLLIPFPFMKRVLDIVPVAAPFSIKRLQEGMEIFLGPVKRGKRVLMVLDNPGDKFVRLFDGYNVLFELALYIAAKRGIHFMPSFWAVFEVNYRGAPDFWGRDVDSVLKNIKFWKADYVVIYQNTGTELELKWKNRGFEVLSKFSWEGYDKELCGQKPYNGQTPDWWLLKVPQYNE